MEYCIEIEILEVQIGPIFYSPSFKGSGSGNFPLGFDGRRRIPRPEQYGDRRGGRHDRCHLDGVFSHAGVILGHSGAEGRAMQK